MRNPRFENLSEKEIGVAARETIALFQPQYHRFQCIAEGILSQFNMQVTIANDGLEAIQKLTDAETEFDLVLMDIQMPGMDGYQATTVIRQNPKWKDLPIIAMTANAMEQDVKKSLSVGMNAHVAKPVNVDELRNKIVQWAVA